MDTQNNAHSTVSHSPAPGGITIIYEDRVTGLRAKRFSDMLSASLDGGEPSEPGCWRLELLDLPGLADKISQEATASEFLILSLRGDTSLSNTTKQWLESWLENAKGMTNLIALFDPVRSVAPHAEGIRCYLRHVTTRAGVAFFGHCTTTPDESCGFKDEDLVVTAKPDRRLRNIATSLFPTAVSASFVPAVLAV